MTRSRIYGEDTAFGSWIRKHKKITSNFEVVSDIDFLLHRYLHVVDSLGTRDMQSLMLVEVKTRGAFPSLSQKDSLHKQHVCTRTQKPILINKRWVRHWGQSFLQLSGTDPDNSEWMCWGRFDEYGEIDWGDQFEHRYIDIETLDKLLSFELHPDKRTKDPLRRHHSTKTFWVRERQALPFEVDVCITKQS